MSSCSAIATQARKTSPQGLNKSEDSKMNIFSLPCFTHRLGAVPVLILLALLLELVGCSAHSSPVKKLAQDTSTTHFENNLTFNDVNLEQTNAQGKPVWNVKAKQAIYSNDKKIAQVQNPKGELFQEGKVVYQITGDQGELQQDGKKLFLKGHIVVKDPQNGVELHGNEMEWRPGEDLLIVRNQLTITRQKMQITAQEARMYSRVSRMELQGQVVALSSDPYVQVRTEHLTWQIKEQKLSSDARVQIDRVKGQAITDRATANQADVDLKTKIVTLKQNAQLALADPPLQVTSNELSWNLNAETLTANQPLQALDRQQQVNVSATSGWVDLQKKIVYLTGNVYGVGQRGQSLNSAQLTWYLPTRLFEANGNVVYHQIEPPASFAGQKAVGRLEDQSVVVSGGGVVTQIVP